MEKLRLDNIEQITTVAPRTTQEFQTQEPVASITLRLGEIAMRFSRIERVPRYADGEYESDAEHSFMLALVATEIAYKLYPNTLDIGKVSQYAIVHDLIELKTNDVPTFSLSAKELARKEQAEREALPSLLLELPPYTSQLLEAYEKQEDSESRFVRAVDKTLPVTVDLLGDSVPMFIEDYGVTTIEQLVASHEVLCARIAITYAEFPEIVAAQRLLCDLLEEELAEAFKISA